MYFHSIVSCCFCSLAYISVSPMININGGGVHPWYMMFGQQCSISMFFSINFEIKGWESAMLPPFGETLPI